MEIRGNTFGTEFAVTLDEHDRSAIKRTFMLYALTGIGQDKYRDESRFRPTLASDIGSKVVAQAEIVWWRRELEIVHDTLNFAREDTFYGVYGASPEELKSSQATISSQIQAAFEEWPLFVPKPPIE
jgi:hypothetical protein